MEKLLTTEDRIRRAEEIYERRKNKQVRMNTATVNVNNKKNFKLLKKMLLQILACSIIYYLCLGGHNIVDFSSQENIEKLKLLVNKDTDFEKMYQDIQTKFNNKEEQEEKVEEKIEENSNQVLEEATLSAAETISEETEVKDEVELTQMEIDANTIKQNYSLIRPVEGKVSSGFGQRESNNSIVSSNHLGIDLAANEGTKIVATMEGEVTIAKYSDSYRKLY